MRRFLPAALLAGLILAPSAAFAWGAEGHRIIADIAAGALRPHARQMVGDILRGNAEVRMREEATWADEIVPQRPETAPWHYVNIPLRSAGYDPRRDCRNDDCVVAQITSAQRAAGDAHLAQPLRAEALRFLIHFVADVHQPLHAADNGDRGGNEIGVVLAGRHGNLHGVWDRDVVLALGDDEDDIALRLEQEITPADKAAWSAGTPADWANESLAVARSAIYADFGGQGPARNIVLPRDYARIKAAVAGERLKRAGIRLAMLLNRIFP